MAAPIHLLYSFSVFTTSRNMADAAQKLGITQPALTKQLQLLQGHFSQALFSTQGRSKVTTSLGAELGRTLTQKFNDLENEVDLIQHAHLDPRHVTLKFGARKEILDTLAHQLQFPGNLIFQDLSSQQISHLLLSRELQLAITQSPPVSHELISQKLFKDTFVVLVPKYVFKKRPAWNLETHKALEDIAFLSYASNTQLYQNALPLNLQKLKPYRTYSNWRSLLKIAESQDCWTLAPSSYVTGDISKKYWVLDLPAAKSQSAEFSIVFLKEYAKLSWFKNLILEIQSHF